MKNWRFHIVLILLGLLTACDQTNWQYTLDKNSTEPYGLYLAYDHLEEILPNAEKTTIYDLMKEVYEQLDKGYFSEKNTLLISVTANMHLNKDEATSLYNYVFKGGNVLLVSGYYAPEIDSVFEFATKSVALKYPPVKADSISRYELFWKDSWHRYGLDMPFEAAYFDSLQGESLGQRLVGNKLNCNLQKMVIGEGQILISTSPEMLTNYALLKDSNIAYYEKLLSHFKIQTYYVKWFSKHTMFPKHERTESNLSGLLKYKSYRYAFYVLLAMAILFFYFETRRRQRAVEVIPPVTNDSLAFTETIGKLYYGEKDNRNLAGKMIQYYLEHIRTTHNVPTAHLNNEMAIKLAIKINKPEADTINFINYLNTVLTSATLSEQEIKTLYHTLKKYN